MSQTQVPSQQIPPQMMTPQPAPNIRETMIGILLQQCDLQERRINDLITQVTDLQKHLSQLLAEKSKEAEPVPITTKPNGQGVSTQNKPAIVPTIKT